MSTVAAAAAPIAAANWLPVVNIVVPEGMCSAETPRRAAVITGINVEPMPIPITTPIPATTTYEVLSSRIVVINDIATTVAEIPNHTTIRGSTRSTRRVAICTTTPVVSAWPIISRPAVVAVSPRTAWT